MNEKVERLRKGVNFAKEHIDESNYNGAVIVLTAVLEQMVALMEKRCLDHDPDGDVTITFEEDCDGQAESQ